jgi:hypothetical protein
MLHCGYEVVLSPTDSIDDVNWVAKIVSLSFQAISHATALTLHEIPVVDGFVHPESFNLFVYNIVLEARGIQSRALKLFSKLRVLLKKSEKLDEFVIAAL